MELFRLLGTIAIENEEANAAMDETTSKASKVKDKLASGIGTAAKWGGALVGGAAMASTALVGFASSSASAADTVDKMSAKIGLSKQGYQEWAYVMGQNGMNIDSLQMGMKTLITQMDGVASGTASSIAAFDSLGLSVYDANGNMKDQETMMKEVMYALADMENGTEKARLANELFGRSGSEMMPMLNQGAQGMKDLTDRAHELGLIMSDESVNAGVALGDIMDDVKQSVGMLATKLGTSLFPILQTVCEQIIANMPMIQSLFDSLAPVVSGLLEGLLPPLLQLVKSVLPTVFSLIKQLIPPIVQVAEAVMPVIVKLFEALLPPLVQIVQTLLPAITSLIIALLPIFQLLIDILMPIIELFTSLIMPIVELIASAITPLIGIFTTLIQAVLTPLQPILDTLCNTLGGILTPIVQALSPVFQAVAVALSPLMDLFSVLIETLLKPIIPLLEVVAEVVGTVLGGAFKALQPVIESIMDIFGGLINFITGVFTGNWEMAWDGIVNIFKGIFNLIPSAIEGIINGAIGLINGIIGGINKVTSWVGIPAIPDIPTVSLPKLEEGGILEKGQVGLLEGNGAEAVVPLENNKKWIASIANEMQTQGIGGDAQSMNALLDIMKNILAAIQDLNMQEIVQVVPDEQGIFEIVKKQSIKNAALGKPGIVV